ncbi:B12-binding domain-containing radical SAM protein [Flavihumibacter sp. R14]|nr:B12-binding domain-containing radical SAM protein [Flavihumibacter soli]
MKNILFSHSYFLRLDPKQWKAAQPYAPLGTLYAAAVARREGYEVSLFDTMFSEGPDEIIMPIKEESPDYFVIYDDGFNYLTKMCLSNMREAAFHMIRIAKQFGCIVLVSSSDSSDHYERYLNEGADFVLIGEAEETLVELINRHSAGSEDFTNVNGIAYSQNGGIVKTPGRKVMTNLDSLPLPAWDLVDIRPYQEMWQKRRGYFSMNIGTTRGCPFKCNWCAKPIYGNRYNSRSPANVIEELKYLKKQYDFDHIWFCDDIFGLKPRWLTEFSDLVTKEDLKFRFKIQSRADLLLQEDNIRALARAGCNDVWIGAESGSQKILDAMDKGIRVEQIREALILLRKNGIKTSFFIQFGYLGETKADIEQTIKMINDLLPDDIGISVSYPLPGTVFYEKVKSELGLQKNWKDSDDLKLMFKNTYSAAFYKQLYRYVHRGYHLHQSLHSFKNLVAKPFSISYKEVKTALWFLYYFPAYHLAKSRLNSLELNGS